MYRGFFVCKYKFSFLRDKCPGVPLLGCMVVACLVFFKNCQGVFQSVRTILYSHQYHMSDPASQHSHQHLVVALFFILVILIDECWCLIVVLISISLMANDVTFLFTSLFAIYILFNEMFVCNLCPLSNWIVYFGYCWVLRVFYRYEFFVRYVVFKCFLPGCSLSFHSFHIVKVFSSDEVQFIIFFLYGSCFWQQA